MAFPDFVLNVACAKTLVEILIPVSIAKIKLTFIATFPFTPIKGGINFV